MLQISDSRFADLSLWIAAQKRSNTLSPLRHVRHYSEAAAVSNISVTVHQVTFDPEASWLKFHLGINRYALYSRDDPAIPRLLKEMQSLTVIGAGDAEIQTSQSDFA